ncbi:hypothetical protein Ancab_011058, partial [Ancistrocladus abbreviatus]
TTEEASVAYNKAVTRLREYQGVDPHFDTIARQYHEIMKEDCKGEVLVFLVVVLTRLGLGKPCVYELTLGV